MSVVLDPRRVRVLRERRVEREVEDGREDEPERPERRERQRRQLTPVTDEALQAHSSRRALETHRPIMFAACQSVETRAQARAERSNNRDRPCGPLA